MFLTFPGIDHDVGPYLYLYFHLFQLFPVLASGGIQTLKGDKWEKKLIFCTDSDGDDNGEESDDDD